MRTWIQIGIFGIAFIIFYAGLAAGLIYDPNLGTALWALGAITVALNIWWILRSNRGVKIDKNEADE